jgi:hypothetical protein
MSTSGHERAPRDQHIRYVTPLTPADSGRRIEPEHRKPAPAYQGIHDLAENPLTAQRVWIERLKVRFSSIQPTGAGPAPLSVVTWMEPFSVPNVRIADILEEAGTTTF